QVRGPFIEYLKSSVNLWSDRSEGLQGLSDKEQEELLSYAFERYFRASALFGAPETCLPMVGRLAEIGVREIACLIDFGVDADVVLDALPALDKLRRLVNGASEGVEADKSGAPSRSAADQGAPTTARPVDIPVLKQERSEPDTDAALDHRSLLRWLRAGVV